MLLIKCPWYSLNIDRSPANWTVCSTDMIIGHINILQNNDIHTDTQRLFATVKLEVAGERVSSTDD